MDWAVVTAVSELAAAVAVVASLVYLAAQIRQNTRQVQEQVRAHYVASLSDVGHGFREFRASVARDHQVASVWVRGNADLAQLDNVEHRQFDFLAVEFFWSIGMMWLYVQEGVFEPDLFEQSHGNVGLYAGPGLREWWRTTPHRREYPPGYVERIDAVIEQLLDAAQPTAASPGSLSDGTAT
jgi:hypothetical protein